MELPEQIRDHRQLDDSIRIEPETKKRVRFSALPQKSGYALQEKHKIILLAGVVFLLFIDTKVKNYFMNILVVIFGETLRTSGGGTSKIGLVMYSMLFILTLFVVVSGIEMSAMTL
jgi:hypothetical protein